MANYTERRQSVDSYGYGTIYQFDVASETLKTIYNFAAEDDGFFPGPALINGKAGALYGVATAGPYAGAAVFSISPDTGAFTSLHVFPDRNTTPSASLTPDAHGLLYGSTMGSGNANATYCFGGCGTLFKVNPTTKAFTTIYKFKDLADGAHPMVALSSDGKGNLYGGTYESKRANGHGTIFRIADGAAPAGFKTVYTFPGKNIGKWLAAELVLDPSTGVFYGVGASPGVSNNAGTIFRFNPQDNSVVSLHTFPVSGAGGNGPSGALASDGNGSYYGVTAGGGGKKNAGIIYVITP